MSRNLGRQAAILITTTVLAVALAFEATRKKPSDITGFGQRTGSFFEKLKTRAASIDSLLCVGLDPHIAQIQVKTANGALQFCKDIVDATVDVALAYKPNAAFFEVFGAAGAAALKEVVDYIPPEIPVLLDAKRGDIGTTAEAYASAAFEELGADAVTVNAYMGSDTVKPFLSDPKRGVFVLCKTSNASSREVQTLGVEKTGKAVYEVMAELAEGWNSADNVGLVVGATDSDALERVRAAAPSLWILAPGVGAQGGDLDAACRAGLDASGMGMLIPISRGISRSENPGAAAMEFRDRINAARSAVMSEKSEVVGQEEGVCTLQPYQKEFMEFALAEKVLRFGSFTLKSGRQSPYFFNAGLFNTGEALLSLGRYYAQAIVEASPALEFDVVFGPAYKGISLGAAVALTLSGEHGINVGFTYNRKEKKDHGEGGVLVGADMAGKRVLVVDDVITAGTAIREAAALLESAGAILAGVVIALDRQEVGGDGGTRSAVQMVEEDLGIPVVSVIGLLQIEQHLSAGQDSEVLEAIQKYRAQFGIQT